MNRANRPQQARIPGSSYASRALSRAGDGSTLSLDFTTGVLDSRITFSRADATPIATYINNQGYVTTVASAQDPRFDYSPAADPTTSTLRGLLIEQSVTNLVKYSQALNQISSINQWFGANFNTPTVPASPPTDPFGGTSASWKLIATAGAGYHVWRFGATYTAAAYTFSFWAKAAEYDKVVFSDVGSGRGGCRFDLTNQTATVIVGTVTPTNPTIVAYGNGWFRCSFTMTMTAVYYGLGVAGYPTGTTPDSFGASYTANGTSGVYLTGMQAELSTGATSYIQTAASSVTRAVDTAIIAAGANFDSWYTGGTTGTFVANWYANAASSTARSVIATNDQTTKHLHLYQTPSALTLRLADFGAAATVTTGNSMTAGALTKGAFSYASTATNLCLNGGTVASGTLAFSSAPTWLSIGAPSTNGTSITGTTVVLNNSIRSIKYWPTVLPNTTLQSLTA